MPSVRAHSVGPTLGTGFQKEPFGEKEKSRLRGNHDRRVQRLLKLRTGGEEATS